MKNIKLIKHNTFHYYEECVEHYYVGSIPHVVETYHNRETITGIVNTNNTTVFYGRFIKRGEACGFNIKKTNKYTEYNITH